MSTVVYQGLQSSLESQLKETRTLRLKLASPKPPKIFQFSDPPLPIDLGGFNFIQTHPNSSQSPTQSLDHFDKETPYVPPMARKSLCILSERGLELCTENLGSETGTETIESTIFSLPSLESCKESPRNEQTKPTKRRETKKERSQNFPPPLSSSSLQVRAHREGGRLIINATEAPKTRTYLQAERTDGRLRLSFLTECDSTDFDSEVEREEREEKGIYVDQYEKDGVENETNGEEDEEEEEEIEIHACGSGDIDGNSCNVGVEMGMEKFQRPSRCNEGGRGNDRLCRWEPFWVAT